MLTGRACVLWWFGAELCLLHTLQLALRCQTASLCPLQHLCHHPPVTSTFPGDFAAAAL